MKRVFSFRVSGALASPGVVTTVIHSTGRRRGGLVEQYRYRVNPRCYACITYAADWVYFFFFQKLRSVVPRLWRPRVAGSRHHSTGPTTSWGTGDKNLIYKICIIHHIRPTIYLKYIYIYIYQTLLLLPRLWRPRVAGSHYHRHSAGRRRGRLVAQCRYAYATG